jgi:hypothetical protein
MKRTCWLALKKENLREHIRGEKIMVTFLFVSRIGDE